MTGLTVQHLEPAWVDRLRRAAHAALARSCRKRPTLVEAGVAIAASCAYAAWLVLALRTALGG